MPRQLDVLFVTPNPSKVYQELAHVYAAIEPPTWALLLAESCRKQGFGVAILDCHAENLSPEEAVHRILYMNPRLVCFVTYGQNPNSGTTNMVGTLAVAQLLKTHYPQYKTLSIGSHTSALPHEVLQYSCFDYVSINEGVYTLWGLLRATNENDLEKVPGLGYKDSGLPRFNPGILVPQERMDIDIPGYAWDLLPSLDKYRSHFWHANYKHENRAPFASLYTSLGCQFKCIRGDSLVKTVCDGEVPIKELADKLYGTGIWIWSYDFASEKKVLSWAQNIKKIDSDQELIRVHFGDTYIDVTPDHKFAIRLKQYEFNAIEESHEISNKYIWVEAQNLMPGDQAVYYNEHETTTVRKIERLSERDDVYCLQVPDYNCFFANDILVKNCDFCMINIVNRVDTGLEVTAADSNRMRFWSPDLIIKEIERLYMNWGVTTIRFSDEMFFLNRRYYEPLLEKIVERGIPLNSWAYARIDTVRDKYLELFKKAGVNWLALGIEAANQIIRQEITKGSFEDVDIREVVKKIQGYDINVGSNFIFGFPNEKLEDLQATFDLALELSTEFANFYTATALPGSPLYMQARNNGWELPTRFEEYGFFAYDYKPLPTQYLSGPEVLKFRDEAWHKFYERSEYQDFIERKFGKAARDNLAEQTKIKLKRKVLENAS